MLSIKKVLTKGDSIKSQIAEFRKHRKKLFNEQELEKLKAQLKQKEQLPFDTLEKQERRKVNDVITEIKDDCTSRTVVYDMPAEKKYGSTIPFTNKEVKSLYDKDGEILTREISLNNKVISVPTTSIKFSKYPNGSAYTYVTTYSDKGKTTRMSAKGCPTYIINEPPKKYNTSAGNMTFRITTAKFAHMNKSPFNSVKTSSMFTTTDGVETEKILSREIVFKKNKTNRLRSIRYINNARDYNQLTVEDFNAKRTTYITPDDIDNFIKRQPKEVQYELIF